MDICLELFVYRRPRKSKFLKKFSNSSNILCRTFAAVGEKERQPYKVFLY